MPYAVTATPYGRPAAQLLADQVRACKRGDPFAPVTVVVPATYAGIAARRRLARDGVVAVTFVTGANGSPRLQARTWSASSWAAGRP